MKYYIIQNCICLNVCYFTFKSTPSCAFIYFERSSVNVVKKSIKQILFINYKKKYNRSKFLFKKVRFKKVF